MLFPQNLSLGLRASFAKDRYAHIFSALPTTSLITKLPAEIQYLTLKNS